MKEQERGEATLKVWAEERTFVRALVGKYAEVYQSLVNQPRVYKSKDFPYDGGPVLFDKRVVAPWTTLITQAFETHFEVLLPGGRSQKHGHMNSAVMYILEGRGYDIHDGERWEWEAGDVLIVKNGCVHQHFNADPKRPARILLIKAKPLFMFFHLLFQKNVTLLPKEPVPGWEGWKPTD